MITNVTSEQLEAAVLSWTAACKAIDERIEALEERIAELEGGRCSDCDMSAETTTPRSPHCDRQSTERVLCNACYVR